MGLREDGGVQQGTAHGEDGFQQSGEVRPGGSSRGRLLAGVTGGLIVAVPGIGLLSWDFGG
ncbi:hypothetical protein [Streptomyces sp. SM11]|uniref:hypothetical protein n=1 Tax=Streptomyces sp. SM11 TaxID=565557 RepID=UPI000CD57931|nr:hypothetical protein [Streptomyces sp. SM11]